MEPDAGRWGAISTTTDKRFGMMSRRAFAAGMAASPIAAALPAIALPGFPASMLPSEIWPSPTNAETTFFVREIVQTSMKNYLIWDREDYSNAARFEVAHNQLYIDTCWKCIERIEQMDDAKAWHPLADDFMRDSKAMARRYGICE